MKGPHGPAVEVPVPTGLTIFAATYLVFIAGVLAVTVVATCRRQGSPAAQSGKRRKR